MALQEQIIRGVKKIGDLQLLNQVFQYVQSIKRLAGRFPSNSEVVLAFAGTLSMEEADAMKEVVSAEFSKIEGDW